MPTYTANLCPIHCGGAASHPRARTTILHRESWDRKRFSWDPTTNVGSRAKTVLRGLSPAKDRSNEKEMKVYPSDFECFVQRKVPMKDWPY